MKNICPLFLIIACLSIGLALAAEETGEIQVMLIFSQSTGPSMLNRIRADIGLSEPREETWRRGAAAKKKLEPGSYTVVAKNAEVCSFNDCVPCPDRQRTFHLEAEQTEPVYFRWKAKYDRGEKKWLCR